MLALSNKVANLVKDSSTNNDRDTEKKGLTLGKRNTNNDTLTKEEIMKSMGIIDPSIKDSVYESLSSINYKAKSKIEVADEVVVELEKQIDKLKYKRMKILEVNIGFCVVELTRKKIRKNNLK